MAWGLLSPQARIVVLEPGEPQFTLALERVKASGFAKRIELQKGLLDDLQMENTFDVIWFPQNFFLQQHFEQGLERVLKALTPTGLVTMFAFTHSTPAMTLRNTWYGGTSRTLEELEKALVDKGFGAVKTVDFGAKGVLLMAGRGA